MEVNNFIKKISNRIEMYENVRDLCDKDSWLYTSYCQRIEELRFITIEFCDWALEELENDIKRINERM